MGCLFGYCGKPLSDLTAGMASSLAHRCPNGWYQETLTTSNHTATIAHGRTSWQQNDTQVVHGQHCLLGHNGILFQPKTSLQSLVQNLSPEALTTFEGAFTLAFATQDAFYLMRDPTGVKAIYWTVCNGRLLFASEIKALFADPATPRQLRPAAMLEYFSFSFVPSEGTMFENIYELQPGCLLKFQDRKVDIQRYFQFDALADEAPMSEQSHISAVREALEISVEECCDIAQRQTPGVFLSGGIDSSTILAMASQAMPKQRLHSFSVDFGHGETASDNARSVAKSAAQCDLSIRDAVLVLLRNLWGAHPDYTEHRSMLSCPSWVRWMVYRLLCTFFFPFNWTYARTWAGQIY
ncbi:MAG: asparagine synthase-related protein, partial [Pseudomonadota bacterium]